MVVHSRFQYIFLSIQQWLLLAPDLPCAQHVRLTRRISLTVKRPSTKGLLMMILLLLFFYNWLWPFVMLRASTTQLSARPRPRSGCVELMGDLLHRISARTRTRSGACMLDTYMRTTPTLILLDGGPSQDQWAAHWLAKAITARPRPTRDSATRHPCRQAASFLPCTRAPDFVDSR
jgi:hypothetical protein